MIENGLYLFYLSMAAYEQQLNERAYSSQAVDDDLVALTLVQIERPLIIYLSVLATTIIVFIIEIFVRLSCKVIYHHK